ncbi:MAG: ElyC/SanA/YdcF family protein [Kiritimatiellae bacterium]|nr:ElyC/SanA/YdcF family protein [Kiritimatiellia bacterium]
MLPHLLKRILGQFLMPLPLVLELFLLGWMIRHWTRFKRTGSLLRLLSGVLFLAFGYGIGNNALYRLERQYPPFDPTPAQCERLRGCDIVVLGQGLAPDSDLPVRFRDNDVFRARMMEAARVARLIPDSRLLISMAGLSPSADKQVALEEYAAQYRFGPERLAMFTDARDTAEETARALSLARTNVLILVTSASHLPRALRLFAQHGSHPLPASCDYAIREPSPPYTLSRLPLPTTRNWLNTERYFHEMLGGFCEMCFGKREQQDQCATDARRLERDAS